MTDDDKIIIAGRYVADRIEKFNDDLARVLSDVKDTVTQNPDGTYTHTFEFHHFPSQ